MILTYFHLGSINKNVIQLQKLDSFEFFEFSSRFENNLKTINNNFIIFHPIRTKSHISSIQIENQQSKW